MSYKKNEFDIDMLNKKMTDEQDLIEQMKMSFDNVINKQVELFKKYLEKINPVIEFIYKKHYRFNHPQIAYNTPKGPILGYDEKENSLIVYDVSSKLAIQIDIYNEKEFKFIDYHRLFSLYGFETAINGLLHVLTIQANIITQLQNEIEINEKLLEKYALS